MIEHDLDLLQCSRCDTDESDAKLDACFCGETFCSACFESHARVCTEVPQ